MTTVSVFAIWYLICVVIRAKSICNFIDEHEDEEIYFQDSYSKTLREFRPKVFEILLFVVIFVVCSLLWPVHAICIIKNRINKRRNA